MTRCRGAALLRRVGVRLSSRRAVRGVAMLVLAAPLVVTGVTAHHVFIDRSDMPDLVPFVRFEPPRIGEVYDSDGDVLIELAREYRRIVSYEHVPEVVRDAVLAAEDRRFFSHAGVDYAAWPRVAWKAAAASLSSCWHETGCEIRLPQGGSTITQQLVRGFFLRTLTTRERGAPPPVGFQDRVLAALVGRPATHKLRRKLEEMRLALWLEEEMARRLGRERAKREIFARYVSFIYMGHGRYGFAAACEYYFGRSLPSLGARDVGLAALLAGIPKSPAEYAPRAGDGPARTRRDAVLRLMARNGRISWEAAKRAQAEPVRRAPRPAKTIAPAAIDTVFEELRGIEARGLGVDALFDGRIGVRSTVSAKVQRVANEALEEGLARYERRRPSGKGIVEGAAVVLRNVDAGILAEVGGRRAHGTRAARYTDFNRVTEALRQPGSAIKPVVYLAALREGFHLDSLIPDAPIAVVDGTGALKWVSNYDGEYLGPIPLRVALARSRNTCAVWLARQVGMSAVRRTARSLGIRTPLRPYLSTALGASELRLIELTNAYRAIASGIDARPHVIERVTDPYAATVYRPSARRRTLAPEGLPEIQEGLRGVVRLPGGTAHSLDGPELGVAVIGKTGTTSGFRDALFIGSTWGEGGITVGVWIGFDDNRTLGEGETGARTALPVFREIVRRVYAERILGPAPRVPREIDARIEACSSP